MLNLLAGLADEPVIWHIDQFIVFIHNDIVLRSNHESIRLGVLVCMPQHQRRVTCSMPHRPQLAVDLMSGGPIEQINYVRYVASSRVVLNFSLHRGTRRTLYGCTRTSQ